MDDDLRNEIARASEGHDRLMAADAADAARDAVIFTEAIAEPYKRRGVDGRGLAYRARGDATDDAPAPAPAASDAVPRDELTRALGQIIAALQQQWEDEHIAAYSELREEYIGAFAKLQVEVDKLRGELRNAVAKTKRELGTIGRNGIEVVCTNVEHRFAVLEAENIKLKAMLSERPAIAAETAPPRGKQNDDKVKELAAELENERADRMALLEAMETRFNELKAFVKGVVRDFSAA